MNPHLCEGDFKNNHGRLKFKIILFSFKDEDGLFYFYSPQLDITTYGETEKQAKDAFKIHLDEFFKYTLENKTLNSVLEGLGWEINQKTIAAPHINRFMQQGSTLADIFGKYSVNSRPEDFQLPALI